MVARASQLADQKRSPTRQYTIFTPIASLPESRLHRQFSLCWIETVLSVVFYLPLVQSTQDYLAETSHFGALFYVKTLDRAHRWGQSNTIPYGYIWYGSGPKLKTTAVLQGFQFYNHTICVLLVWRRCPDAKNDTQKIHDSGCFMELRL